MTLPREQETRSPTFDRGWKRMSAQQPILFQGFLGEVRFHVSVLFKNE